MAFLTPLYLLGGLAVSLPILFHLIRRTPKGRQVFSSLMFLQPSPPRVTKRSRVEDWWLLILRGIAICLLALAFSRPFFRQQDLRQTEGAQGRQIAILVDTSASMQRGDLWTSAKEKIEELKNSLQPADTVCLLEFNHDVNSLLSFSEWNSLEPDARDSVLNDLVEKMELSQTSTTLGEAMIRAADLLNEKETDQPSEREMYVISDFQSGSHWESLNGYTWPEDVRVELIKLKIDKRPTNASIQYVNSESVTDDDVLLRVTNSQHAQQEQFKIGWVDDFSPDNPNSNSQVFNNSLDVYIPPGHSRVVHAPALEDRQKSQRLAISGDDEDFDNLCFIAQRRPWDIELVYLGESTRETPNADSLRFFLDAVFPSTAVRNVSIHDWQANSASPPIDGTKITLLVVGSRLDETQLDWARNWLQEGGKVLFVARDAEQARQLYALADLTVEEVTEAEVTDYTMLETVDFSHPVLAPFNDPRFANFSKLRFNHYRKFLLESLPQGRVLASFESKDPAIVELEAGKGKLMLFTSGWNRSDSQLAVWSKFVPLMNGILEYLGDKPAVERRFIAGERIHWKTFGLEGKEVFLRDPDGEEHQLDASEDFQVNKIGIWIVASDKDALDSAKGIRFVANLPPEESKLDPLSDELLIAAGVPIKTSLAEESQVNSEAEKRQLLNRELESKQQLWKWILVAALFVLILESLIAGMKQHRRPGLELAA